VKQLNIKQWWAWLEWISKASKPRTNAECSPDKPQQLNHHRWKKHTVYLKYISKHSIISEWIYGTHMWQYILNISCMFEDIGNTDCDETWLMHSFWCVFCFQMHIFKHEPQPLKCPLSPVPSIRSMKTNYASCFCFCFFCLICSNALVYVLGLLVS